MSECTNATERLRRIYERDKSICGICHKRVDLNGKRPAAVDHIVPRSQGGSDDDENLQLAHSICNSKKARRSAKDFDHDGNYIGPPPPKPSPHTSVRNVPDEAWRELKAEAARQGEHVGDLLARYITEGIALDAQARLKRTNH